MAITTGFRHFSMRARRSGKFIVSRAPPDLILPNSLMSAPETNVRPPPMRTQACTASSLLISSIARAMPSGTPGLNAFTGGLLMVITAMPLSFVSCTRSVIEGALSFRDRDLQLRAFRGNTAAVNHQRGDALAMKRGVAEGCFRRLRAAIVKVNIVFPGETHAAMDLDATIAHGASGVAGIHLGDGNGGGRVRRVFFERPSSVIHSGT